MNQEEKKKPICFMGMTKLVDGIEVPVKMTDEEKKDFIARNGNPNYENIVCDTDGIPKWAKKLAFGLATDKNKGI